MGNKLIKINNRNINTINNQSIKSISIGGEKINACRYKPKEDPSLLPYLTFSSPSNFTLNTVETPNWDGTIEYSTDTTTWTTWDGTLINSENNKLYLRGKGNTIVSINGGFDGGNPFRLTGENISCDGNIETLLDYEMVMNGEHPPMGNMCFVELFGKNTSLIKAPKLPILTLTYGCYVDMFASTSITEAPELPATTLAETCYQSMFYNCQELKKTPVLPATTLSVACYAYMFANCSKLEVASELPATTLAEVCYFSMFYGCKGLTTLPKLPATILKRSCYEEMFRDCENIKLSSIQTSEYSVPFRIPDSGVGTDAESTTRDMFLNTGGDVVGTLNINTTYYTTPLRPLYDINITYGVTDRFSSVHSIYIRTNKKPTAINDSLFYVAPGGETIGETYTITETLYIWGLGTYKLNGSSEEIFVCDSNGNPIPYENAIEIPISQNTTIELKAPQSSISQGDVIRLTDNGQFYKVLTQVARGYRVMDVSSTSQSKYNTQSRTEDVHGVIVQEYFQSDLMKAGNTYYKNLPTSIKNAVLGYGRVEIPYEEFWVSGQRWYTDNTDPPVYNGVYQSSGNLYNYQLSRLKYSSSISGVCHPPTIEKIFKYLGVTPDMTFDNTTLTSENIWKLFFPTETSYPVNKKIWLCDANANDSSKVFCVNGNTGKIDTCQYNDTNYVRPIFIIDLEQVEFNVVTPYLTFSSPNSFTLRSGSTPNWDGTLEYSTDTINWTNWDGSLISSINNKLYLRGKNNTHISCNDYYDDPIPFVLTGTDISCNGNIETLLDYEMVLNGEHPPMERGCFMGLFQYNASLISAPELPAITLVRDCYYGMFEFCVSLVNAPKLPATILAEYCYSLMFYSCTSLEVAPDLPAATLSDGCYSAMFWGCTALTTAPKLPATSLALECYTNMFNGCTSLIAAPELPSTTLANGCYLNMFMGCTALTTIPKLPATSLVIDCYINMFMDCTNIKLSTTKTGIYQTPYRIPTTGTGTSVKYALDNMFSNTGGTFTGTPSINTTYYIAT